MDKEKNKGGRKPRDVEKKMQDAYVEARVNGASQSKAKEIAGYTPTYRNEMVESEPRRRILAELKKRGIDEDFVAGEFASGLEKSKTSGARELDLNSHGQYLKQLGWIFGYARKEPSTPAVAVQINNNSGPSQELDAGSISELARLVEAEIRNREPDRVHADDSGIKDAEACPGVGEPFKPIPEVGRGGGA